MKIFVWKKLIKLNDSEAAGAVIIADSIAHAYALLSRDTRVPMDSNIYSDEPNVTIDIGVAPSQIIFYTHRVFAR